MRIIDLDQSSEAWLEWRKTGIGSSDAPSVLKESPWKSRFDLWEEKVFSFHRGKKGLTGEQLKIITSKMNAKEAQNQTSKNRGKNLEPEGRRLYEELVGYPMTPVCGVHEELDFLKVSLDGWNEERRILLEIKAPNQESHQKALSQIIPRNYVPQLLHQMATSEALEARYLSLHPKFPPGQRLAVVPINKYTARSVMGLEADLEDQIEFMKQELSKFWICVMEAKYKDLGED